ncbi:MAG: hypothetical protein OXI24_16700 [Candidatus Poribacteria bacterium]|nr:hypothetical protein [Candidatus Poribacteria bacterium]
MVVSESRRAVILVEGLGIESPDQLVEMATLARSLGLHIVNAGGAGIDRVRFNTALGNDAAEVAVVNREYLRNLGY